MFYEQIASNNPKNICLSHDHLNIIMMSMNGLKTCISHNHDFAATIEGYPTGELTRSPEMIVHSLSV